jgi:hypothetical protein
MIGFFSYSSGIGAYEPSDLSDNFIRNSFFPNLNLWHFLNLLWVPTWDTWDGLVSALETLNETNSR